jgi:ketosteroid isomerase-like protein
MSNPRDQELIQRMRQIYEAFNCGDFDVVIEMAHPDIVLIRAGAQGELRGAETVRAWMEPDAFDSQKLEPLEFRVDGNGVLVHVRGTMRGAGSGIEMDIGSWTVWTFDEDARVTRVEVFLEHEEIEAQRALQAP